MGEVGGPFAAVGCGVVVSVEAAAASFDFADCSTAASSEFGAAICAPPPWIFEASEGNGGFGMEGLTIGASFPADATGLTGCNCSVVSFCVYR